MPLTAVRLGRGSAAALCALALAGLTGCAGLVTSVPAPGSTPVLTVRPLHTSRQLGVASVDLDPPGLATAGLTPAQALSVCARDAVCGGGIPVIHLAKVTTHGSGTMSNTSQDATVTPTAQGTLSYVLSWQGQQCPAPAGPGPQPGQTRTPFTPTSTCADVVLVDATTGTVIGSIASGEASFVKAVTELDAD